MRNYIDILQFIILDANLLTRIKSYQLVADFVLFKPPYGGMTFKMAHSVIDTMAICFSNTINLHFDTSWDKTK